MSGCEIMEEVYTEICMTLRIGKEREFGPISY